MHIIRQSEGLELHNIYITHIPPVTNLYDRSAGMELQLDLGGQFSQFFLKYIYIYIYIYTQVLILVILFYKITFFLLNNIINFFKSIVIVTNISIIFLQTVKVANFYC